MVLRAGCSPWLGCSSQNPFVQVAPATTCRRSVVQLLLNPINPKPDTDALCSQKLTAKASNAGVGGIVNSVPLCLSALVDPQASSVASIRASIVVFWQHLLSAKSHRVRHCC